MGDLDLQRQAFANVAAVKNDPRGRYQRRVDFYQKYGYGIGKDAGFGNSELAFLEWEIGRGVLNPVENVAAGATPGSRWWRDVNSMLMYDAELAALIWETDSDLKPEAGAQRWLDYIEAPSEKTWYLAHNGSIVGGYLKEVAAAFAEEDGERRFMNIVLYRVLYAEALVSGSTILGLLGKLIGNPVLPAVKLITEVHDFYPRHYPLTRQDISNLRGKGDSIWDLAVRLFDDELILPAANSVYEHAAAALKIPALTSLLRDGRPIYPID